MVLAVSVQASCLPAEAAFIRDLVVIISDDLRSTARRMDDSQAA